VLEAEVGAAAREFGMNRADRTVSGSSMLYDSVIATFSQYADGATPPGPVVRTQSGAFGTAIVGLARRRSLGTRHL